MYNNDLGVWVKTSASVGYKFNKEKNSKKSIQILKKLKQVIMNKDCSLLEDDLLKCDLINTQ